MILPVRRLAAQDLNVGSEHGVEEGVGATETHLHDGGRGDVGVAVLLEPGHETGQRGSHICRSCCAYHLETEMMMMTTLNTEYFCLISYLCHGF